MSTLESLEKEVEQIKVRNQRVEADKAWETSLMRRFVVTVLTYLVIVLFFYMADLPSPWTNSIVPALAFVLSTATLPLFKNIWLKSRNKKD